MFKDVLGQPIRIGNEVVPVKGFMPVGESCYVTNLLPEYIVSNVQCSDGHNYRPDRLIVLDIYKHPKDFYEGISNGE